MQASSPFGYALRALPSLRRWLGVEARSAPPTDGATAQVRFRCNLCGNNCAVAPEQIGREIPSCDRCGSTVRFRAMVHLLTEALLGHGVTIPELPLRKDIRGIGLSDAECYAQRLAEKFDYTNTYFHTEPRLNIADVDPARAAEFDFIIASDVFEHVTPPVSMAFANARRLLKRGGALIFSVPFSLEAETLEHFPLLHEFSISETPDGWRLFNRDADGRMHVHDDLVFHGGPGSTLEMRHFSRAGLEREFASAGFSRMRIAEDACPEFGISWSAPWSVPIVAYA